MTVINDFHIELKKKLEEAVEKFNLPALLTTEVRFDLKGNSAGQAMLKGGKLILRFNQEAIEKGYKEMVEDTIPHEVAHLVCFVDPSYGKSHDKGWSEVAKSLGGSGNRIHQIELTKARRVRRYFYVLSDGSELALTKEQHTKLQEGQTTFHARDYHTKSGTPLPILKDNFVKEMLVM